MSFPSLTKTYHNKLYPSIYPEKLELSTKGKVILITGAGSGIGQATAVIFARAGAKALILCGRRTSTLSDTKEKIESLQRDTQVVIQQLDISDETSVSTAFKSLIQTISEIDIVINCAGHMAEAGSVKDISTPTFWTSFEVNLKGSFILSRAFLQHSPPSASKPKVLLLLSSCLATLPASQVTTAPASYALSKLAEAKLAEYLALENPNYFRTYALQPGIVETEMSIRSLEIADDPEAARASFTWDEPDLPAGFMLWLCSGKGECMPSGRFLWTNWDVDELEERAEEIRGDSGLLTVGLMGWPFGP